MSKNLFEVDYRKVYFVTQSSQDGSEIVNISSGKTIRIDQRLPMGSVCHGIDYTDENIGTQYLYDLLCPVLKPQKVNVGGLFESFAIRMDKCQVIQNFCDGNKISLQPPHFDGLRIKDIYQTSEKKMTLKEYISDKINDG
uniref:Uncharacterized protein n=1 Tax=Panagrolaimus sp. PS1159 TaxID=55785 RepID=A0AC35GGI0_9BILA